ncbi:MAG TPA: glycosyltransferase [Lentimicrobium sp.]|nr:glycosyltransferase [Lentimicrobium sp.]
MSINRGYRVKVYATLPVLNETDNLPSVIDAILNQEYSDIHLVVCVNQPDEWHAVPDKSHICRNNLEALQYLYSLDDRRITIIDKSTPGNGWIGRKHGVGWARKTAMDAANELAQPEDIILSIDADTWYTPEYFSAVVKAFDENQQAAGLSVPYYHPLTGDEITDRCVLRYEIYMRNYALNMLLINNPYSISAIGSGMACTAAMYRKVRGITPKMSGEDFYFIQKLKKAGNIIIDCDEVIYPASRFSDRVYFGTGPAMIKGRAGSWESYPVYDEELFKDVKLTFNLFCELYTGDVPTPMDDFLLDAFQTDMSGLWRPLRENCRTAEQFFKAAMQKVDGLRILQFLKIKEKDGTDTSEERLARFLNKNFSPHDEMEDAINQLLLHGFDKIAIGSLNLIRDFMFVHERSLQKEYRVV